MMSGEVRRRQTVLTAFFTDANRWARAEPLLTPHLGSHACILLSGYVEQSVIQIAKNLVAAHGGVPTRRFARASIEEYKNPNFGDLLGLVDRFDANWKSQLKAAVPQVQSEALNSVMLLRNHVAHGRAANPRYQDMREAFPRLTALLETFEAQAISKTPAANHHHFVT